MFAQLSRDHNIVRVPVSRSAPNTDALTIRRSGPGDGAAISRLARLDDRRFRRGPYVVAEQDGEIFAATPISGGPSIADPFRRTADVVSLLELRARQMGGPAAA